MQRMGGHQGTVANEHRISQAQHFDGTDMANEIGLDSPAMCLVIQFALSSTMGFWLCSP